MSPVRSASASARYSWGALLSLLLCLRLLTPAGFMPAFERGAVSLVACDDGFAAEPRGHHEQHGERTKAHQPCPYAAASSLGGVTGDAPALVAAPLRFHGPVLALPTSARVDERRFFDRPPARGPPTLS